MKQSFSAQISEPPLKALLKARYCRCYYYYYNYY